MRTLQEVIQSVATDDVVTCFKERYPECETVLEDLPHIVEFLKTCEPMCIDEYRKHYDVDDEDDSDYVFVDRSKFVCGKKSDGECFSLSGTRWRHFVSLPVESELNDADVTVSCIFEMTIWGADDDFQVSIGADTGERFKYVVTRKAARVRPCVQPCVML